MKNRNLGKLALIAGGIYAVKAMADKSDEEKALNNMFAGLQQNATAENGEIPFSPNQFKKWIDANPALKAALRSSVTAEQVIQNINNNVYQLENVQFQNFGGSLITNLEKELLKNSNVSIAGENQFLPTVLKLEGISNVSDLLLQPNPQRLYKCSFFILTNAVIPNTYIGFRVFNNDSFLGYSCISSNIPICSELTYIERFVSNNVHKGNFSSFFIDTPNNVLLNSFCFTEVSLGEPVPDNLPYLPTGQMVYDTTTGEVGRYNGTTVDYFTMAV